MGPVRTLAGTCRKCHGYGEGPDRRKRRGPLNEKERAKASALYNRNFFEKDPDHARAVWRASAKRNKSQRMEAAKRRWANRDVDETKRKYAEWKAQNADHVRAYDLEYQRDWRERNLEKCREKVRKWRAKNPKASLISNSRWRARKAAAAGQHTYADIKAIYAKQSGRCFYCDEELTDYHVDHFIPLAKGGTDYAENLRIACPTCNCRKSAKMPWDWMPERFSAP